MTTWTAETVPAYLWDPSARRFPQTDEPAATSAPQILAEGVSEDEARTALADHLERIATLDIVRQARDEALFETSARTIRLGAHAVRIYGRVYQIREEGK